MNTKISKKYPSHKYSELLTSSQELFRLRSALGRCATQFGEHEKHKKSTLDETRFESPIRIGLTAQIEFEKKNGTWQLVFGNLAAVLREL